MVIQGMGGLARWNWPDIAGLDEFKARPFLRRSSRDWTLIPWSTQGTKIHSADYLGVAEDQKDKTVAVVGSVRSSPSPRDFALANPVATRAPRLSRSSPLSSLSQSTSTTTFECVHLPPRTPHTRLTEFAGLDLDRLSLCLYRASQASR